jgi:uncharacterized membrane protein YeaQ/YmgE (transglycosylase-associated protein family)
MTDLIWIIVIGGVAGWLSGHIMKGYGLGLFGDMVVGVIGAFLGKFALQAAGVTLSKDLIGDLIVAFFGAIVLLLIVRLFTSRKPSRKTRR